MKRLAIALGVVLATFVACSALLPEEYAVNADLGALLLGRTPGPPPDDVFRERMQVPVGFALGVYAEGLENARFLRFTAAGDLLVSTPRSGAIRLIARDADGDGRADGIRPLLEGLNRPHGLALRDGWLYVGETDAVVRTRFDAEAGTVSGELQRVITGLPGGGNHWTRTLDFGPDGGLYVSVGSSCNVCVEEDPRRAALLRFEPDGSGAEVYATGLRNAVGFAWQPGSDALYATDNGRDLLGDDFPPCELNRVERGGFYGWPHVNGDGVVDPDLGEGYEAEIARAISPAHDFRAHNAPLGITFARGQALPGDYREAAFVALHGSWNRTRKDGYKVVSLHWDADGGIEERDFLTGFLVDEDVIGRPVDVAQGPDGAIYVSDDYTGSIYRVAWIGEGSAGASPAAAPRARSSAVPSPAPPTTPAAAPDPAAVERGAGLYAASDCASCHEAGAAAEGTVVHPLAELQQRYDAAALAAFLQAPTPPMPAFPFSDAERADLAAYLLSRF